MLEKENNMLKKSFLQNIWKIIVGNNTFERKISEIQAEELQKNYKDAFKNAANISEYPPYIDIVRELLSEKSEIFQAAVHYLCRIAENESKYAEPIFTILEQYQKKAKRDEKDLEFLSAQLQKMKKNIPFLR